MLVSMMLVSCITERTFPDRFVETLCSQWDACNTSGDPCPAVLTDDFDYTAFGGGEDGSCDFHAGEARDCLDEARWECFDDLVGQEAPVAPEDCSWVCGGGPLF